MWGNAGKYAQVRVPLPIKDAIESEDEDGDGDESAEAEEEDEEESEDVTVADMMAMMEIREVLATTVADTREVDKQAAEGNTWFQVLKQLFVYLIYLG